ncbi:MAG: hypothetical protein ABL921_14770 [Pirellula sp.]
MFKRPGNPAERLGVEVLAESEGLRLMKIGVDSPLRNLATSGDSILQGTMEIGDRIVAINGVFSFRDSDLQALMEYECCEITVLDYRTSQTVSWLVSLPLGNLGPLGN